LHDGKSGLKEKSQTKRRINTQMHTASRAEAVCSVPVRCICSLLNISRGTLAYHSLLSVLLAEWAKEWRKRKEGRKGRKKGKNRVKA